MTNDKKPVPLENLSEYLRANPGDVPVVDMGRIIVPKRSYTSWLTAAAMVMILAVGGMTTYRYMSVKEMTVVVDVHQGASSQAIAQMVAESGGEIIAVKQTEDSTYEVKVTTRKSRHSFLEWLRKNKDVKMATELKE